MNRLPNSLKIAVFGDLMLDLNTYSKATKIANEAPIPVFHKMHDTYHLGGAGNVLKNLAALGCSQLYAFGAAGNDTYAATLRSLFTDHGIIDCIQTVSTFRTIVKHRYFCDNKIVFRSDTESDPSTLTIDNKALQHELETLCLTGLDCIILSDYNKGFLNLERCQMIIQTANKYNILTVVDPKEDYYKYVGCTLIKPNRQEAYRLFSLPPTTPLEEIHRIIQSKIGCKYSVITLAEEGMTVSTSTDYIKTTAQSQQVIDVTGAGDIVTAVFAFYLANKKPIAFIAQLATQLATLSVQHSGSYMLQKSDLYLCELERGCKLLQADQLSRIQSMYPDKKIVFTNGCFDLLHNGHIELFKFCKEKGDLVIVGVNSDASIKRLKGSTRPIQSQITRLAVLEAISYIDYIVVFDEDTPENLIKDLQPHYLIKGGDYKPEAIIGAAYAKETLVCDFVSGVSSTNTIKRIVSLNN
jgi:D-beta-D-heptose 7-phosphate kinase/D-beta-D-heptose 1-phosphate adenosyltransferase